MLTYFTFFASIDLKRKKSVLVWSPRKLCSCASSYLRPNNGILGEIKIQSPLCSHFRGFCVPFQSDSLVQWQSTGQNECCDDNYPSEDRSQKCRSHQFGLKTKPNKKKFGSVFRSGLPVSPLGPITAVDLLRRPWYIWASEAGQYCSLAWENRHPGFCLGLNGALKETSSTRTVAQWSSGLSAVALRVHNMTMATTFPKKRARIGGNGIGGVGGGVQGDNVRYFRWRLVVAMVMMSHTVGSVSPAIIGSKIAKVAMAR